MGWTSFRRGPNFDEKAEIRSLLTWPDTVPFTAEIVKMSKVGSVWYVACRKTPKPGEGSETFSHGHLPDPETGAITFAAVILTSKRDGEFAYKDMDEGMGPVQSKAPLSLINVLSPTTSECANEWRERCRIHAGRPKPKIGDKVRLHEPWEPYGDEFEKIEWPRTRGVYRSLKTGAAVRLHTAQIKEIIR